MTIALTINGEKRLFHGDPRTPLVDVLRNELRMLPERFPNRVSCWGWAKRATRF